MHASASVYTEDLPLTVISALGLCSNNVYADCEGNLQVPYNALSAVFVDLVQLNCAFDFTSTSEL